MIRTPYIIEYTVLKNNKSIKQGYYKRYYEKNRRLLLEGEFKDNTRSGIWRFYDPYGSLIYAYDYEQQKPIKYNTESIEVVKFYQELILEGKSYILRGANEQPIDTKYPKVEIKNLDTNNYVPPIFIEGNSVFQDILFVAYKNSIKLFDASDAFLISFEIDSLGNSKNFQTIVKGQNMTELKFISNLESMYMKWIPAYNNNKAISVKCLIPVRSLSMRVRNDRITNLIFYSDFDISSNKFRGVEAPYQSHGWIKSIH